MRLPGRRSRRAAGLLAILAVATLLVPGVGPARAARTDARIGTAEPTTLDPAAQSDIDSAVVAAQLFETLTTFDVNLVLRPALASSWDVSTDGRQVVFHLRPSLAFSDGSALTAEDVVRSWLRLIDPARPSPLVSLVLDVKGVLGFLRGQITNPDEVGIHADGSDVVIDLDRPGADFPSIVASPTFGVVPRFDCASPVLGQCGVSSGGYTVAAASDEELTLAANTQYWAGTPAIGTLHLVMDYGGRSPVEVFEDGDVDYTGIASNDATWITFDSSLGPSLRQTASLSLTYLGFDTTRRPFNDARVRRAVAMAVDWQRNATLSTYADVPADSMVPPAIPGRTAQASVPAHDPEAARALLAEAGYPGGTGFPSVVLGGGAFDEAIAADLKRELGITVRREHWDDYFARLSAGPSELWTLSWIADYPGENDFLGVLLETGSPSNYGHWTNAAFDDAIDAAQSTRDPAEASRAFDRALEILAEEVPTIPLAYAGPSWALSRHGLLGAGVNALGIPRYAGLAWAP
jgi:oligopeptide transport system substrate-binding protein